MNSFIPFSLHQVVKDITHNGPTGQPSLIDLVFLSNLSSFRFCNIISPLGNSDHNGLQLSLSWSTTISNLSSQSRSIWNYSQADFSRARDLIDETNWDSLLSENLNVSLMCWQAKFLSIMELCIPRVVLPLWKIQVLLFPCVPTHCDLYTQLNLSACGRKPNDLMSTVPTRINQNIPLH